MEDAEAEAVLLALGPQLKWTFNRAVEQYWSQSFPPKDIFFGISHYCTGLWASEADSPDVYRAWLYQQRGRHVFGPFCVTEEAAKLACERHYATGKWD